jgi:hypothetical protein
MQCATIDQWPPMAAPQRAFLENALSVLRRHPALVGIAAGGSFATGRMDEFSDLDLVVAADPAAWPGILDQRRALAASLGPLLASFTGEHVGEPRLLICLYGPPLVHVDLKFVIPADLRARVEDPVLLWDRDGAVAAALAGGRAVYPAPDLQWIEDRIWVWVHYGVAKIGRGELLEACDFLAFLLRTIATPEHGDCLCAFRAAVALYRELRADMAPAGLEWRTAAEQAATAYLDALPRAGA